MIPRKRTRPSVLQNFQFQTIFHEIVSEAEQGNYAEIWLLKEKWRLMWRMCKYPEVTPYEEHDSFMFEGRRYVMREHEKPPSGILDLTSDDDAEG